MLSAGRAVEEADRVRPALKGRGHICPASHFFLLLTGGGKGGCDWEGGCAQPTLLILLEPASYKEFQSAAGPSRLSPQPFLHLPRAWVWLSRLHSCVCLLINFSVLLELSPPPCKSPRLYSFSLHLLSSPVHPNSLYPFTPSVIFQTWGQVTSLWACWAVLESDRRCSRARGRGNAGGCHAEFGLKGRLCSCSSNREQPCLSSGSN